MAVNDQHNWGLGPRGLTGNNGTPCYAVAQTPRLLTPSGSQRNPFSGWSLPFGTYTATGYNSQSGTPFSSKSAQAQELLTAMNRQVQYFYDDFQIYEVVLPSGREGGYLGAYVQHPLSYTGAGTIGAWVKRISGNMPSGNWCNGYDSAVGGWQLCGAHFGGSASHYTHCHPYGASGNSACTLWVALPGFVEGWVDLSNNQNWFMFTNQDGGQG